MWPFKSDRQKIREEEQERIAQALENTFKSMQDRLDHQEKEIEKLNKQTTQLIREVSSLRVNARRNKDLENFFSKFFPENEKGDPKRAQWKSGKLAQGPGPMTRRSNVGAYGETLADTQCSDV